MFGKGRQVCFIVDVMRFALSCVQSCQVNDEGTRVDEGEQFKNQCNNKAHYVMKWGPAQIVVLLVEFSKPVVLW